MDSRDVENLRQLLEFQSRMLQANIQMNGMIAENKQCEILGRSLAFTGAAFDNLISKYAIGTNDFPTYMG